MALDPAAPAILAAAMPCWYRRVLIEAATTTDFAGYGFFPLNGQNIDTPYPVATKWTTDAETHPIP